jgi:membrane protease YdiL (CAAX protease family)
VKPRILYSARTPNGWPPWGALLPVLAFVFVAVPSIGVAIGLEHLSLMDARGPVGASGVMALLLSAFPLIALVVWAWVRFVERRTLDTIGLVGAGGLRLFLQGHAIGVLSVLLAVGAIGWFGGYRAGAWLPAFGSPGALAGAVLLLLGFAVQSSVEEIVFRGWLLSGLARKFNLPLAVLLTSGVFGLLHYSPGNAFALVGTFMFSVFTCCWALRTNNVWGVMGWHSGWNWLLCTGFELPLSGTNPIEPALLVQLTEQGPKLLTGGAYGPEASLLCIAALVAVSAALVLVRRAPARAGASTPA